MKIAGAILASFCSLLAGTPLLLPAQEPILLNARAQTLSAAAGLNQEFQRLISQQSEPAWLGYAFVCPKGRHQIGCASSRDDRYVPASFRRLRCRLENRSQGGNFQLNSDDEEIPVTDHILVFFRIAAHKVERIRLFSEQCELDAGGLPVFWLVDASPQESIKLLSSFAQESDSQVQSERAKSETAVAAIALHDTPAAAEALEAFVDPGQPESLRRNTAFWLGNVRGQTGCQLLGRMLAQDPSDKVREHCIFALHVSKAPGAINGMIKAAREDRSAHVREQALFWLSQKAGKKVAEAIADAVENDPDTAIKKKAVFALSQLPKDEGIPRLIHVARSNQNREVRKEAMFWLGQSKDSRARDFFEEVLMK